MFVLMSTWWFWLTLALLFFLPLGYGWGYRGWGAPYPTYFQRRRMQQANSRGATNAFDHQAWGWGGDLVWMMLFVDTLFVIALFWRR